MVPDGRVTGSHVQLARQAPVEPMVSKPTSERLQLAGLEGESRPAVPLRLDGGHDLVPANECNAEAPAASLDGESVV